MRLGKAVVVLACMCLLGQGMAIAQQDASFESLLSDIGKEPTAVSTTAPDAAAESVPAPAQDTDVLSAEPVAADEPAAEPADVPATEPEPAVVAEPVAEPAAEPAVESVESELIETPVEAEVAEEPAVEPVVEPAETAEVEVAEPAVEAAAEPVVEAAAEPVAEAEGAAGTADADEIIPMTAAAGEEAAGTVVEAGAAPDADSGEVVIEDEEVSEEAEPGSEEEVAAEKKPDAEPKDPAALAAQEEVRRRALEIQGMKSLEAGNKAMVVNDFEEAVKNFEDALANIPERPARMEDRNRTMWGLAEANYRIALDIYKKQGNLQEARQDTERALKYYPEHKGAATLLEKIKAREVILARPLPPAKRPDVVEKKKTIAELISEGKQYFAIKDYNRAETLFEKVLLEDEYNSDAMRYLKKIGDIRYELRTREREAVTASMMQDVRKAWNAPIRREVQLPETVTGGAVVQTRTGTQRLQDKMAKIMIPSIEFRQANINDVVNFLVEESIRQDADGGGVNIILNMSIPGQEQGAAGPAFADQGGGMSMDLFGDSPADDAGLGSAPVAAVGVKTITLNLRRISLLDAIKYITEVAGLKYRMEDNAVIITPAGVVSGHVITRMYPVQPSILDVVIQKEESDQDKTGEFVEMGGGKTTIKRGDVKDFFEKSGVPFPVGTSITYNPSISQLIVANTPENLDTFERILAQLNVIPSQIEIEARFVEVGEDDLEELGFQWILNDNWEIAENESSGPLGGRERIQINADSEGFTKGLRFFGFDTSSGTINPVSPVTGGTSSPLGGILTAASVLTNPELKVILEALSQSGNSDVLSAPRITTKNGVNAQIQIVKEYIYPTEFEVTQPTVQSQGDLVTPPTVTPGSFETRETGVILNVTPAVGPDGYTIDLTLVPEVCELEEWLQYGSEITIPQQTRNPITGLFDAAGERTYRYNIPQPVFSSRNATTSIVIWDGQTVVMGGLIREELVTYKDKIPFLGDIPIIGRLFRSEGQQSRKTNLLIFVTARLVDPSGKPIHKAEAMAMPGGGSQAQPGMVTK